MLEIKSQDHRNTSRDKFNGDNSSNSKRTGNTVNSPLCSVFFLPWNSQALINEKNTNQSCVIQVCTLQRGRRVSLCSIASFPFKHQDKQRKVWTEFQHQPYLVWKFVPRSHEESQSTANSVSKGLRTHEIKHRWVQKKVVHLWKWVN